MKDLAGTVVATARAQLTQLHPFVFLLEVVVPTTPPTIARLTNYDEVVSRGVGPTGIALNYQPIAIAIGDMQTTNKGDLSDVVINISNVRRDLMSFLETYDGLVGQEIKLMLVNVLALTDPSAQIVLAGRIATTTANDKVVTFRMAAPNLTRSLFPKNRYLAFHCGWRYGSAECGYVIPTSPTESVGGGFSTCGKTFEQCEERGEDEVARGVLNIDGEADHPRRIGCYPGIQVGTQP